MSIDGLNGAGEAQIVAVRGTAPLNAPVARGTAPLNPAAVGTAPLAPDMAVLQAGQPATMPLTLGSHPLLAPAAPAIVVTMAPAAIDPQSATMQAAIQQALQQSRQQNMTFYTTYAVTFTPEARQAVLGMVQNGRLDATDGQTNLRDVASAYLAQGGPDTRQAAQALFAQLANPDDAIAQMDGKDTCVAATMQLELAKDNPALYFKLATELLDRGEAELPDGQRLAVSARNRAWLEAHYRGDANGFMNGLVQTAFMDYAAGADHYDVADDAAGTGGSDPAAAAAMGRKLYKGLDVTQAEKLDRALAEAPTLDPAELRRALGVHLASAEATDAHKDDLFDYVADRFHRSGHGLLVALAGDGGSHLVKLCDLHANGDVEVEDAVKGHGHGQGRQRMSREEFTRHLALDDDGIGSYGGLYTSGSGGHRRR